MSVCSRFPLPWEEGRLELCQPPFPKIPTTEWNMTPPQFTLGTKRFPRLTLRAWMNGDLQEVTQKQLHWKGYTQHRHLLPCACVDRAPFPVFPSLCTLLIPEMLRPVQLRQNSSIQLVGRSGWINRQGSHNPPHLSIQRGMSTAHRPDCDGLLQAGTEDLLKAAAVVLEDRILQKALSSTEPHRHLSPWQAKNETGEKDTDETEAAELPNMRHLKIQDDLWTNSRVNINKIVLGHVTVECGNLKTVMRSWNQTEKMTHPRQRTRTQPVYGSVRKRQISNNNKQTNRQMRPEAAEHYS